MSAQDERVVTVASVAEALSHLTTQRGQARIVASPGGLGYGMTLPDSAYLVDVSEVAALRRVERSDGALLLGSAVSMAALAKHPDVSALAPLIAAAAEHHVSAGRDSETLGARIVSSRGADPMNVALVTLGTQAEITNLTGNQWLPVASLYVRQGVSRVDSSAEILTRVRLPEPPEWLGAGLGIIAGENGGDTYTLGLVVGLAHDGTRFSEVRLAHGAAWLVPSLLPEAATLLADVALDDKERLRAFVAHVIDQGTATLSASGGPAIGKDAFREACHRALKSAAHMARRRLAPPAKE